MSPDTSTSVALRSLDEETWGERVARARGRCRLSLKEAAARVSTIIPVSYSTLMRFESLDTPPEDLRRQIIAYLTIRSYGYAPEEFGLSADVLPRSVTADLLAELSRPKSGWFTADELRETEEVAA